MASLGEPARADAHIAASTRRCTYVKYDIPSTVRPVADKPLVWVSGEVKTPPFSAAARVEAGVLLRRLQSGESLEFPHSRPMPSIAKRCHELRIVDERMSWRIVYRLDHDAVVILAVFRKATPKTPARIIEDIRRRLRQYDALSREK